MELLLPFDFLNPQIDDEWVRQARGTVNAEIQHIQWRPSIRHQARSGGKHSILLSFIQPLTMLEDDPLHMPFLWIQTIVLLKEGSFGDPWLEDFYSTAQENE